MDRKALAASFDAALAQHRAGHLAAAERLYTRVLAANPRHTDALRLRGLIAIQTGRPALAVDLLGRAVAISPHVAVYQADLGLALRGVGRLEAAASCFRRAIACDPGVVEAHVNLGATLQDLGRITEAVTSFEQAIALQPGLAEAHFNLGNAHQQLGRTEAAVACFQRATALLPAYAAAHNNLGTALRTLGSLDAAIASFAAAIAHQPGHAGAHHNLGVTLLARGAHAQAVTVLRQAVRLAPTLVGAYCDLGLALAEQGQLDEAIACHRRALALDPFCAEARINLGLALRRQGALDEAVACLRMVLPRKDRLGAVANNNLGAILTQQGNLAEAVIHLEQAIALNPHDAEPHANLGVTLTELGRLDEAVASLRRALALRPADPDALMNLGLALHYQRRLAEATACVRQALAIRPDMATARFNLALLLLAQGEMEEGWRQHECRWQTPQMAKFARRHDQPQWRGEPAEGRTLFIHHEQGFGDSLQFCRFATLAHARGLKIVMEVQRPLLRLMRGLAGVSAVIPPGSPPPAFDLHCPMLSLPLALGTTLATVPAATPYLRADAAETAAWDARLSAGPRSLRVGLVWAGSYRRNALQALLDGRRSLSPEHLAPLGEIPGVQLFSLQKEGPPAPPDLPLIDHMAEIRDFADTAALICNLDLVISVDTAVVHLAGALGKPVWLLDRFDSCWRWLDGRRDSPWYPRLRIYRQPRPGDWSSVVDEVVEDLRREKERPGLCPGPARTQRVLDLHSSRGASSLCA